MGNSRTGKVVTPQDAVLMSADAVTTAACTTRGPTPTANMAAANITAFAAPVPAIASDLRISKVALKGIATGIAGNVVACVIGLWDHDGTTARLKKEILVTPPTVPSATQPSFELDVSYDDFVLPAGHTLYYSTSVLLAAATSAIGITVHGATM